MDFASHILVGLVISNFMVVTKLQMAVLLISNMLPDAGLIPGVFYYWKDRHKVFDLDFFVKNPYPKLYQGIYDFLHSFVFLLILGFLSFYFEIFFFILVGSVIHVMIDYFCHKGSFACRIFWPSKKRYDGIFSWTRSYFGPFNRHKIIFWGIMLVIYLVTRFIILPS